MEEREPRPTFLSEDEARILNKFFPAPDKMGGRYFGVQNLPSELGAPTSSYQTLKRLEKRGVLMLMDAGKSHESWFLTDQGLEALKTA